MKKIVKTLVCLLGFSAAVTAVNALSKSKKIESVKAMISDDVLVAKEFEESEGSKFSKLKELEESESSKFSKIDWDNLSVIKENDGNHNSYVVVDEVKPTIPKEVLTNASAYMNEEQRIDSFGTAVGSFRDEFDSYINVTAMNVEGDRESLDIPGFDSNYVYPSYQEVARKAFNKIETKFMNDQFSIKAFDTFRKNEYAVDNFSSMIESNFSENYSLKYSHTNFDGFNNESINVNETSGSGMPILRAVGALSLSAMLAIAEVAQAVIDGIIACVEMIKTAFASSVVPIIGQALFVVLIVAALVLLAILIIKFWEDICVCWKSMCDWFMNTFSAATSYFQQYFAQANDLIAKSTYAGKVLVGDKVLNFEQVYSKDRAKAEEIATTAAACIGEVYLIKNVCSKSFWISPLPVPYAFCVVNRTHSLLGLSSYTYLETTARELIVDAGSGLTTLLPEIHCGRTSDSFMWHHFHNYNPSHVNAFVNWLLGKGTNKQLYPYDLPGADRIQTEPYVDVHSFFGAAV